jgi:hypothetical protein
MYTYVSMPIKPFKLTWIEPERHIERDRERQRERDILREREK